MTLPFDFGSQRVSTTGDPDEPVTWRVALPGEYFNDASAYIQFEPDFASGEIPVTGAGGGFIVGDMPFMKVRINRGRPMLTGRMFNCPMTVLLDGQRMLGMVEELFTDDGVQEVRQIMRDMQVSEDKATQLFLQARSTIDDLVTANAVAGVEIYSSLAAAPAELQRNAAPEACGIVALWTGSRR